MLYMFTILQMLLWHKLDGFVLDELDPYISWCYILDAERGILEHIFLLFLHKQAMSSRNCYLENKQVEVSPNIIMIAWVMVDFDSHVWIENKQADVGQNYCALKCIFRHISIYKGSAAKIFKDLEIILIIYQFKRSLMLIEDL